TRPAVQQHPRKRATSLAPRRPIAIRLPARLFASRGSADPLRRRPCSPRESMQVERAAVHLAPAGMRVAVARTREMRLRIPVEARRMDRSALAAATRVGPEAHPAALEAPRA